MNPTRLNQLLLFYEEDPSDPFNMYALALEYGADDPEKATYFFQKVLTQHSDYLPAYYQAAGFFAEADDRQQARQIFEKGIQLAETTHQPKALLELRAALSRWLDEWDEEI